MPSVLDVFEVILEGELLGQQIINVRQFRVEQVVNDGGFEQVLDYFEDTILPLVKVVQTTEFEWSNITINNLTDPDEFAVRAISVVGTDTGGALPPHSSISIKMQRGSKITRNGYLRHAGVTESMQTDGLANPLTITNYEAAYVWLLGTLSAIDGSDTIDFVNVIVGRNTDGSYDLDRVQIPTSIEIQSVLTTQRSRKIGVGR